MNDPLGHCEHHQVNMAVDGRRPTALPLPCGGKKRARRTLAFRPQEVTPPALHARCANSTCGQTLEHSSVPFDSPPSAGAPPAAVRPIVEINFQRATQLVRPKQNTT